MAILLVGIPLAAILFPALFGIAAVVSVGVAKVFSVPDLVGALMAHGGGFGLDPTTATEWLGVGLVICLPGSVAMLLIWRAVLVALAGADFPGVFATLGARPPQAGDGEERQLVNVTEEIAIAALLPAPRVMLLDFPGINVAAVGATPETATLFVTRGLLDRCNRDETQALIADAIASIGNGDLRVTLRWMAVSLAFSIARQILQAPYSPVARGRLRRLRGVLWGKAARSGEADAAGLAEFLRDSPEETADLGGGRIKFALGLPFFSTHAVFNAVAWLTSLLFLSPALTLLLRRRRYLADAIAVQLTRYPDGLAGALSRVICQPRHPPAIPGLLALLFVAQQPNQFADNDPSLGFFFGSHPSLSKRHHRVSRMGLLAGGEGPSQFARLLELSPGTRLLVAGLMVLLVLLGAAAIYLMLYLILALTAFSLIVGMGYVLIVVIPIRWLLGA